ncbi:putative oxalocrotonate tautomerase [Stachybotrys elegans]|uniref:Oxalocrotonate tautomerase n=1 Tax=Stachybotrys elegans TaxID=80388 RepID=A0A8K0SHB0_9HYPO|nr:putative oxalocrotonate tautomerase [Stachybotrys elegans]
MPLWIVYHPEDTFVDTASKEAFSKDITSYYTKNDIPAFYVVVNFIAIPTGSTWVGGKIPEKPFIRLTIDHLARTVPPERFQPMTAHLNALMKPHITDKGYDHEFHITQSEKDLWRINGLIPPPFESEARETWFRLDKPVPYEGHPEFA